MEPAVWFLFIQIHRDMVKAKLNMVQVPRTLADFKLLLRRLIHESTPPTSQFLRSVSLTARLRRDPPALL